jgi:hypothetical protein
MKIKKIKGMEIIPPKNDSGTWETSADLPIGGGITICVGKRHSGKGVAVINLIEKMGFDYCIAISPTMKSNKEIMSRINIEHVFEDVDDITVIDQVKQIVKNEADDLERYEEELKEYYKTMTKIKDGVFLEDDDLMRFYNKDSFKKPEHRWNGRKPKIACIIDDCLGSMIYSKPRKLNSLSTYSRHLGQLQKGGAIGISIYFMIQSYRCQVGGLTPTIRNQASQLLIFKTKDERELQGIAESVAGEIDFETFYKVYNYAIGTGENFEFLFIDLHKKSNHASMFRKYFSEYIIPENL